MKIPHKFTRESFYGFDMGDDEVGPGEYRCLAIELKNIFEGIAADADEQNDEIFLTRDLEHALRRFLVDPTRPSLEHLLEVSPTLIPTVEELQSLLRMRPQMPLTAPELLRHIYASFNRREIDTVLAAMHADVDWPNGWEGGRVHGHAGVRDYWTRQFKVVSANVEPQAFRTEEDGRIVVTVHQIVRDMEEKLLSDSIVEHVYTIENGLIRKMDIRS